MDEKNSRQNSDKWGFFKSLKWYEHLAAGWPLILMLAGGAVGGACGGAAYFLNVKLFNSQLSKPLKYIYSFLIGAGFVILYLMIIVVLLSIFPGLARK